MEKCTLQKLLDLSKRKELFIEIGRKLEEFGKIQNISHEKFQTPDGVINVIFIGRVLEPKTINHVKLFIGAQHNEYNGLFGIIDFLNAIKEGEIDIDEILSKNQLLIFMPLLNPYGFLNPSKENKSGYYLRNGSNLNRFWRRTFVPDYEDFHEDSVEYPLPKQCLIVKNILNDYWQRKHNSSIYFIDFHETSLLYRFPRDLNSNLTLYYKFDHWLKEAIIKNIIDINDIKVYRKPLFYKCNPNADHEHANLTLAQIDTVFANLHKYLAENQDKLAFYYCYSDKSKNIAKRLGNAVYEQMSDVLWETMTPAYDHHYHDHGCFVKMSDATDREKVYSIELESEKHFFNLFEEIAKSNADEHYFDKKLRKLNLSIQLVVKTIELMVKMF